MKTTYAIGSLYGRKFTWYHESGDIITEYTSWHQALVELSNGGWRLCAIDSQDNFYFQLEITV